MFRTLRFLVIAFSILFIASSLFAQPTLRGDWMAKFTGANIRVVLTIDTEGTGYRGSWASPNQGGAMNGLRKIEVVRDSVSLEFDGVAAQFTGVLVRGDTDELRGTYTQAGGHNVLIFRRAEKYAGTLDAGSVKLKLILKMVMGPEGKLLATLVSPDQSPNEIPATKARDSSGDLHLGFSTLGAMYDAAISPDRQHIIGTFTQGGPLPLVMQRVSDMKIASRPQTPKPPFPYHTEDVTYKNPEQGNDLAGTITIPNGKGPFPAMLFITGSGPQDRDEGIFGHKPFLVIADYLTRHGIATLRVDDRVIGKSTGTMKDASSSDFATDVDAGVRYLMTRPEFNHKKIGLIGHSEGGSIAPMVAARDTNVHFIVLLAGPGVPGDELIKLQRHAIATAEGATSAEANRGAEFFDNLDHITATKPIATIDAEIQAYVALCRDSVRSGAIAAGRDTSTELAEFDKSIPPIVAQMTSKWWKEFIRYDPAISLSKVKCPVLAINGGLDMQVVAKPNIDAIESALKLGKNRDYKTKIFPGLNHLFQHAKTGSMAEYAQLEETFAPEVLDYVTRWVLVHVR